MGRLRGLGVDGKVRGEGVGEGNMVCREQGQDVKGIRGGGGDTEEVREG